MKEKDSILNGRVMEDVTPQGLYQEHSARYSFAYRCVRNKIVLDIGGGTGYGSNYLAEISKMVINLEIDKDTVYYASTRYIRNNLHFICGDATSLPFPSNCFDIVTAFLVIEHLKDYEQFCKECKRVLKVGGVFFCATPNKNVFHPFSKKPLNSYTHGKTPHLHFKEFTPKELDVLLSSYYSNLFLGYRSHSNPQDLTTANIYVLYQIKILKDSFFNRSKHIIAVAEKPFKSD